MVLLSHFYVMIQKLFDDIFSLVVIQVCRCKLIHTN